MHYRYVQLNGQHNEKRKKSKPKAINGREREREGGAVSYVQ